MDLVRKIDTDEVYRVHSTEYLTPQGCNVLFLHTPDSDNVFRDYADNYRLLSHKEEAAWYHIHSLQYHIYWETQKLSKRIEERNNLLSVFSICKFLQKGGEIMQSGEVSLQHIGTNGDTIMLRMQFFNVNGRTMLTTSIEAPPTLSQEDSRWIAEQLRLMHNSEGHHVWR